MFWALSALFVFIDIYSLIISTNINCAEWEIFAQLQIIIALICGAIASINPTPKRRSGMIILFIGAIIIFIIRITNFADDWMYWFAIIFNIVGLIWAWARPYDFLSDALSDDTICLLFYKSDKGSFLMHFFSTFGLPVSSMSIVCGKYWLKLVRGKPTLEIHKSRDVSRNRYVIIDTGVKITNSILGLVAGLQGSPATSPGSLWLRMRCIVLIKPILQKMGNEWVPKIFFQNIPSIYFYKALNNRQQRINND